MTPRIGLLLFTALLMQCENPVETPVPGKETVPAQIRQTDCFNGGNALFHAARITEMGNRASGTPGYRRQMDYLKEELAKCGWTCREQAFEKETPQGPVRFVNLRARFGKAPNFLDPVRGLLTCHIDTKRGIDGFTGANDGASGAAAILETARILSGDPARAGNLELVFFDGEESFAEHMDSDDGLYGSRHYASSMRQPLPEWMINLDMVGRQGKKIRIPAMTPQSMYRVYSRAIRELGYSPEEWGVSGYAILDDHVPFMERGVDTLICGGIGGGAQAALANAGIRLFGGVSGDADAAAEALVNGTLNFNPAVHCDHHEHAHGEGHTCGEHGCGQHSCH